jgi:hypothetical protein
MIGLLRLFFSLLASPFKSKSQLEAENAALRHQLIVDAPTLAQGRLSLLLTLEVAIETELRLLIRRMSVENSLWARRASTVNCSSSALRSRSQA